MEYIVVTAVLFLLILVYFKIADRYNIIDKPNHRSAHTEITLRGGGIIFPLSFILFAVAHYFSNSLVQPYNYLIFGTGLLTICIISFIDDLMDLSSKVRIVFHFLSVSLLLWFINAFQAMPIWLILFSYIMIIGILNAYNFMDGINGMSGLYSLVVLGSFLYINEYVVGFTDRNFIVYPMLATLVFLFFNFRKKAKCFLGDIGSMGVAFWILTLLGLLMIKTGEVKYLLFLTVYGTDVVSTILERLKLKENIFEAHRRHLYQLFSNEKKVSHLVVSSFYAGIQLVINIFIIFFKAPDWMFFMLIVIPAVIIYNIIKGRTKKQLEVLI